MLVSNRNHFGKKTPWIYITVGRDVGRGVEDGVAANGPVHDRVSRRALKNQLKQGSHFYLKTAYFCSCLSILPFTSVRFLSPII